MSKVPSGPGIHWKKGHDHPGSYRGPWFPSQHALSRLRFESATSTMPKAQEEFEQQRSEATATAVDSSRWPRHCSALGFLAVVLPTRRMCSRFCSRASGCLVYVARLFGVRLRRAVRERWKCANGQITAQKLPAETAQWDSVGAEDSRLLMVWTSLLLVSTPHRAFLQRILEAEH